ncbi:MAG: hypothetical protein IJS62_07880, partial [Bacteroidales bacterium]|nr:hypothetical protein [Bacteroidales bacterium]
MSRKNNLRIGCFTLLLLLLSVRLAAAPVKVTGSISDEKGEALMGAIIVSKPGADGQVRNTSAADEKGRFVIECEPGDVLVAYFMGYDDAVVPAPKKGGNIDIVMQPN